LAGWGLIPERGLIPPNSGCSNQKKEEALSGFLFS
jgi:hypothetical protein